jgi:aminoglycoside phosphotransferase
MDSLPHGYSHDTRSDGVTVVKRYAGPYAEIRRRTERHALTALAGLVPVPDVLPGEHLTMKHVAGVHGQELLQSGHAAEVLRSCGAMLRRLQAIDPAKVFAKPEDEPRNEPGDAPRDGPALGPRNRPALRPEVGPARGPGVVVHGDYGPNNMLLDPVTFEVTAIVDWEWAHPGDPVDDLAWCEWIVRMHHPADVDALGHLFVGYGSRPPWAERQRWQLAKCRQMLELVRSGGDQAPGARRWRERIDITASWRE